MLTNCTSRKRTTKPTGPAVRFSSLSRQEFGSIESLALRWHREVGRVASTVHASDLYMGRSVSEAQKAAADMQAELMFVSAGLGLVSANDHVPNYDLTVASGQNSLAPVLNRLSLSSAAWWAALRVARKTPNSIIDLLADCAVTKIFVALPSSYMEMIEGDLRACPTESANKLRIFTSTRGIAYVPERLRPFVMPYDERLEGTEYAGTRSDFPQRALRHFVKELRAQRLSAAKAQQAVQHALEPLVAPMLPARTKATDEMIVALLRRHWKKHSGSSTRLLRVLRDELLIACEQSRFRRLWHSVRDAQSAN